MQLTSSGWWRSGRKYVAVAASSYLAATRLTPKSCLITRANWEWTVPKSPGMAGVNLHSLGAPKRLRTLTEGPSAPLPWAPGGVRATQQPALHDRRCQSLAVRPLPDLYLLIPPATFQLPGIVIQLQRWIQVAICQVNGLKNSS